MELKHIFENSIFYPCSGLDGYSFEIANLYKTELKITNHILVDYGVVREKFLMEINHISGYDVLEIIELTQNDLSPNGWNQQLPPMIDVRNYLSTLNELGARNSPFAYLIRLVRNERFDENHGPEQMNIVFIKGEAIATYQALLQNWNFNPKAVIIKSAGWGWGMGFEDFRKTDNSLEWILKSNQYGKNVLIVTDQDLIWESIEFIDKIEVSPRGAIKFFKLKN